MKRINKSNKNKMVVPGSAFLVIVLVLFIFTQTAAQKAKKTGAVNLEGIPENPISGRIVFEQKGCVGCHTINFFEEKIGPDLGKAKAFSSFYDLASRLWNHAPKMEVQSDSQKKDWPTMEREELNRLVSFLFFLRYLGDPGDAERGKKLLRSKTCLNCHRIGREGPSSGISLDQLSEYASPLYTAQVIWNHGPRMEERMKARGLRRPDFGDRDFTDIGAYLRGYSRGQAMKRQYMSPGNPQAGAKLFESKGCGKCHSLDRGGSSIGPALHKMDLRHSVTTIAARMWNHAGMMGRAMEQEKILWPEFKGSELADLIAFLYFFDYYGAPGSPDQGKQVFENRSCIKCHGADAPLELKKASPTDLLRTMWNHVPYMHEITLAKNIDWPELSEKEMRSLFAYLSKLAVK